MSTSTSRKLPADILAHPEVVALVERGKATGQVSSDAVRDTSEAAAISGKHLKALLRYLSDEGVSVVLSAADGSPSYLLSDLTQLDVGTATGRWLFVEVACGRPSGYYSHDRSWAASRGEKDPNACQYNDLALIELPADSLSKVNPSVPIYGGPVGVNTTGTTNGEQVVSYGNSSLRQGLSVFSPKTGTSLGTVGNGWSHSVYTLTPGIPGDSGSGFLDSTGRAFGTLSMTGATLRGAFFRINVTSTF